MEKIAVLIQNNTKSPKETNPAQVPQHGRTWTLFLMEEDRATYCTISVVPGILKQTQKDAKGPCYWSLREKQAVNLGSCQEEVMAKRKSMTSGQQADSAREVSKLLSCVVKREGNSSK